MISGAKSRAKPLSANTTALTREIRLAITGDPGME